MQADVANISDVAESLQQHVTGEHTLALLDTGLLSEEVGALLHTFLPGYALELAGVQIEAGDESVTVRGHTALPFIADLAAEATFSLHDGVQMALTLSIAPESGATADLIGCLSYLIPGAEVAVPALAISGLSIAIDTTERSGTAQISVDGDWSFDLGATALALRSLALTITHAEGATTGAIAGTTELAGTPLVVSATLSQARQWAFTAGQQADSTMRLLALVAALAPGAALPDEVPDIELHDTTLAITPGTGAFSFTAQSAAAWDLPIGIPNLSVTAEVSAKRAATAEPLTLQIAVGAPGPFLVIDGLELSAIALTFARAAEAWTLEGGLGAALYERTFELHAKLEESAEARVITLAGTHAGDEPLLAFADNGALYGSNVTLTISKPKVAAGMPAASGIPTEGGASWELTANGGISVGDFLDTRGQLAVAHAPGRSSFIFTSDTAHVAIPVPMPNIAPDPAITLALAKIAIERAAAEEPGVTADWIFSIEASAAFADWPALVSKILPEEPIEATLDVDSQRIELTISRFTRPLTLPSISIAGQDIPLDDVAVDASDFSLIIGRTPGVASGRSISLDMNVGIGLPPQLNCMFGSNGGEPALRFFRTYEKDNPESLVQIKLSITPQGLTATLVNSPISEKFISTTYDKELGSLRCDVDMGDFGAFWFTMPQFVCSGADFAAQGHFEVVRDLALPLTPLRLLLSACKLDALAKAIPTSLPLQAFDLREVLRDLGEKLPQEIAEPIQQISAAIDKLPARLTDYANIKLPKKLAFDIAVTASGGARVDIETDPQTPIRVLYPILNPLNPMLAGITLSRFSFGELFGGTLFDLRLNGRIDMFDLVPLGTALLLDELGIGGDARPDTHALGRSLVIDDLRMGLVYETVAPIPVLMFFNGLALEHLGAEGVEVQSHWSFPQPEFSLDTLKALLKQFGAFFSNADALLSEDSALDELVQLTIGANYLRLPTYLHGDTLGKRGTIAQISGYKLVAELLNGVKQFGTGALIEQIPLDIRCNNATAALGPLSVQAQWLLTTPKEYRAGSYQRIGVSAGNADQVLALIPAERRADERGMIVFGHGQGKLAEASLEATLALAATNASFRTYLHTQGRIGNMLDLELSGDISAPERDRAFRMRGASAVRVFGHQLLTGGAEVSDQSFDIDGAFDLFPGTALRVTGSMRGHISQNDFALAGSGGIALGDWLSIINGSAALDRSGVTLAGAWLGMAARFSARADGAQFHSELDIADAFNAHLTVAGGQDWLAPVPAQAQARVAAAQQQVDGQNQHIGDIQRQIDAAARRINDLQRQSQQNPILAAQNAPQIMALQAQIAALQGALQIAIIARDAAQEALEAARQALAAQSSAGPIVVVGQVQPWTSETITAGVRLQGKWVSDLALTSAQRIKQKADQAAAAIEPARQAVDAGQRKVADFDRQIAARRAVVQKAYDDATAKIRAAEADVANKQAEVNQLQSGIDSRNRQIDALRREIEKKPWKAFENGAQITKLGFEIVGLKTALDAARVALDGYKKALATVRSTIKAVPPELDPQLSGLIAARELTSKGIVAAQRTLQAAQQALGVLGSVPGYVAGQGLNSLVLIDTASFSATLSLMQGGNVTMSVTARLMGGQSQTYTVHFNFRSPLDTAQELAERLVPNADALIGEARRLVSTISIP
jgi:predicted  nucleic acid-binding Zn-ribbon protein